MGDYNNDNVFQLEQNLDLFNQSPLLDDWNESKLLTETMLLEGFPLDSTITKIMQGNNIIHHVKTDDMMQELLVCMDEKIEDALIEQMEMGSHTTFICLDSAISNKDKLRMSDKGLIKTI